MVLSRDGKKVLRAEHLQDEADAYLKRGQKRLALETQLQAEEEFSLIGTEINDV